MTNEPVSELALKPEPWPLTAGQVAPAASNTLVPSPATQRGLAILAVALGSGLAGDWLLRATPWGINLFVWLCLTGGALFLMVRQGGFSTQIPRWVIVPLAFFSLALAWRDSATLQALDLLALLVLFVLLGLHTQRGRMLKAGLIEYITTAATLIASVVLGAIMLVVGDIRWREVPRDGWSRHAFAVAKGIALTVPLLVVFGGLLMAADGVFENLIVTTFNFDLPALLGHIFMAGCVAWIVGGYLHGLLSQSSMLAASKNPTQTQPNQGMLGMIEISIVLGALNFMFAVFVLIQFRYLFLEGAAFAMNDGPAFSQYARRGFFELVAVSVLVLPLLLGLHWQLRQDEPRNEKVFRILALIQIALLFVIMASAVQRMRLYHQCCGLTELRIYTLAFQGWLALVFVWFAATVLRGQRERFAFGAVAAGLCVIAALHLLNPDALIARVNVERARTGLHTDLPYTVTLSADAVPALVNGLNGLTPSDQRFLRERLLSTDWSGGATGWRSWNWSRVQAYKHVSALVR